MLEGLIKSQARIKLLKLFFCNREREFYLRELSRLTKENLNSIRRELGNLANIGIVTERKSGNQKLYRVNRSSPIHEELRKIVMKTVGVGDAIRDRLKDIGDVKYALIFGSFSSGEEIKESDIDLLMIGEVDEEKILKVVSGLESELLREISYILWSEREFNKAVRNRHHLILDIVEKPFIMLVGDEDEFRRSIEGKKR